VPDDFEARLSRWVAAAQAWAVRVGVGMRRTHAQFFKLDSASPPPSPPPGAIAYYQRLGSTPVPAWGDVFEFQVHVTLVWTSEGLRAAELKEQAWEHSPRPHQEVARLTADLARQYAPHHARDLETALNARLADVKWQFRPGDATLRCRPEARVRIDDRLREHLEPIWRQMATLETEHEVNQRRHQLVADLTRGWLAVVEEFRRSPAAPTAVRLTEQAMAAAMRQAADGQQETMDWFRDLLETIRTTAADSGDGTRVTIHHLFIEEIRERLIADSQARVDKQGSAGE